MSDTSYDVRIWTISVYRGKRTTSHIVRWKVAKQEHKRRHTTKAMAERFRAELLTAASRGEPFDIDSGLPIPMIRAVSSSISWYAFACDYIDARWAAVSPKHRKGIAEVLTTATMALLQREVDGATAQQVRSALLNWGFNPRRDSPERPADVTQILARVQTVSRPLSDLEKPAIVRAVLEAGATKVDGSRASGRTAAWKRSVVATALDYGVENGLLRSNSVRAIKWRAPRTAHGIDRRVVANPQQVAGLLAALEGLERTGPRLRAFFATLYYAGLRPEEAVVLDRGNLDLPDKGWGWLVINASAAEVGRRWTDSGGQRDLRELKHRAKGEVRRAPCPPALTDILHAHIERFGVAPDGRLFSGERGDALAGVTYRRLWARAREATLSPEQVSSPLARRPYDLRHAAVSTWLNGGVAPTQVAEWAGHSVEVLLRSYAKCMDGGEEAAIRRVVAALDFAD